MADLNDLATALVESVANPDATLDDDVKGDYPELVKLSVDALHVRRRELVGTATSYDELEDAQLRELSAVLTLLRRRSSGPPRTGTVKRKTTKASLADLAAGLM